ncbi:10702_t:CDS:2, partial [Dentiscutata heterogama]
PAYPPERQNIYLSVAVPRGLIILKHSGTVHSLVRTYIRENLNLKCEIPALEILDDGFLKGGNIHDQSNADIFDVVRDSASKDVGVIIGPDSIGTLSFTSGSTGTPKGVRGRHFSLTHYYPWMSQKFGISDKDRFTMLSGIAHDPIQRDNIGVPGKLAEWMAEHEVTITHLTPAMGQLLSANATAPIPTLRNAFFVGDILTKRDCNRLQHLASNTNIINMYGTTETQRSVSYFLIPPLSSTQTFLESQKDIMPAGKGMQNVQLLVVNRRNKTLLCGIGEIGEIYVRAGGLAEGYLRLDDVTNEKFLTNWFNEGMLQDDVDDSKEWKRFWKGKRDRLYKTGDLGRYRPGGDVECVGRVDDQVKIRGFRIELGEIDTHLSQHPLIRENVTLVRRDKYEEQTLVCYFVPLQTSELEEFLSSGDENDAAETMVEKRKYNRLIKQIKDYLKMKVPSYCIPSVFVPLKRMPLTPNGKVDKQALPFPDTAKFVSTSKGAKIQKMSQSEKAVHAIWAQLLPNPPAPFIPLDENFFDLGGHSLLATRLIFELRKKSGVNIPLGLVYEKPTIREQANEIDIVLRGELNMVDEGAEIQAANNITTNSKSVTEIGRPEINYADDVEILASKYLLLNYSPIPENYQRKVFFVTGVTGFLGAFILSDLLSNNNEIKIIAHVRAETKQLGMERLKKSCKSHLVWRDEWESEGRLEVVCGDLEKERLGIEEEDWKSLCERVDVIVHNGAFVHWVYPYPKLRSANVIGTLWCINLASAHHSKPFIFVSSTSVLDTGHYVSLGDSIIEKGEGKGISENDDLE